ncbi:MAG TPA: hypothetical protein VHK88_18680 [Aquihabitans sp.]|jgi:hypothetical protein|nr:hypothetical protein [Aquihabitans sp.]
MDGPDDLQPTEADIEVEPEDDAPEDADADIHRRTMGDPPDDGPGVSEAFRAGG